MSWAQNLLKTYEACEEIVGIPDNDGNALLPIGYTLLKTHITIVLDEDGNFVSAEKTEHPEYISVPCTEESATSRTSGICPHPLFDQLKYVAGDYQTYSGNQYTKHFEQYAKGLETWCKSPYSHPKIESIYKYVTQRTVIKDLMATKAYLNDDLKKTKKIDGKEKLVMADYGVRFKVRIEGDLEENVWLDKTVREKYLQYLISQETNKGICYLSGEKTAITDKHPKGINNNAYGAKLISSNDNKNFTFRGRFSTATEALTVGYESSQKLHQALRWLIATRASKCGKQAVLAWAVDRDFNVEKPLEDSWDIYKTEIGADSDKLIKASGITDFDYGIEIRKALFGAGSVHKLKEHSRRIAIMSTDAATDNTGRLSITYYRELPENEYHERIADWHEQCRWYQPLNNESGYFIGAPSANRIVKAMLGKKPVKGSESYDKLEKGIRERLLHCIMDGERIPTDMLNDVLHRVSNPFGLENKDAKSAVLRWRDWEEVLGVACGLWRRHYYNYEKGVEYKLALEENRKDRNYLYGRLLAVADKLEQYALNENEKNRPTNAIRYMQIFSQKPYSTWKMITELLQPYIMKLGSKAAWYQSLLDEIGSKFEFNDFATNDLLKGSYLLGYYCQRKAINDQIIKWAEKNKQKGDKENESDEQN